MDAPFTVRINNRCEGVVVFVCHDNGIASFACSCQASAIVGSSKH
ncbi:hypothetical protein L289_2087 [Acinetobacter gerneri DSM 14967 = CIP 107464 = MTCC 9824]|nr:hypothetical protein L289_2087 [Acinetobacter gerneri DSM 14967 = CIP 107464 = MTCC 9824]